MGRVEYRECPGDRYILCYFSRNHDGPVVVDSAPTMAELCSLIPTWVPPEGNHRRLSVAEVGRWVCPEPWPDDKIPKDVTLLLEVRVASGKARR